MVEDRCIGKSLATMPPELRATFEVKSVSAFLAARDHAEANGQTDVVAEINALLVDTGHLPPRQHLSARRVHNGYNAAP